MGKAENVRVQPSRQCTSPIRSCFRPRSKGCDTQGIKRRSHTAEIKGNIILLGSIMLCDIRLHILKWHTAIGSCIRQQFKGCNTQGVKRRSHTAESNKCSGTMMAPNPEVLEHFRTLVTKQRPSFFSKSPNCTVRCKVHVLVLVLEAILFTLKR